MKKLFFTLTAVAALTLSLSSCKKDRTCTCTTTTITGGQIFIKTDALVYNESRKKDARAKCMSESKPDGTYKKECELK